MKKAFTLIELIIALMIFSILFLAMSAVISNLKTTKKVLNNYYISQLKNELLIKVLYEDLFNATSIKIEHSKNLDYDRIYLTTSNSLYQLINPYVLWYVSRNKNTLIRVESPFEIKIPNDKLFFLDKFQENVKIFKIYKKEGKDLIVIKSDKPIYFEIVDKDLGVKDKNNSNNKSTSSSSNNNKSTPSSYNNYTPPPQPNLPF